ncbi:hypothetical protein OEZ85_009100 [Tetradesmus obliquus]|uniref:Amino acid transporter transmembrane domain-containing protein n=1 Tax=Tetradesmus obliquus TaxID=3088 RepID=A0ABY8TKR3_TETOB|nr:hypothetical protein OEZ85_009100 [Tetradesmus obliquus]
MQSMYAGGNGDSSAQLQSSRVRELAGTRDSVEESSQIDLLDVEQSGGALVAVENYTGGRYTPEGDQQDTFWPCTFNLSKVIMGAGMMAIPRAFNLLGLLPGLAIMALMACLTFFTLAGLISATAATQAGGSYGALVRKTVGGAAEYSLQLAVLANCYVMNVVFVVVFGDLLLGTAPEYAGLLPELLRMLGAAPDPTSCWWLGRPFVLGMLSLLVLLPLASMRSMEKLAVVNIIGVASNGLFAALVLALAGRAAALGQIKPPQLLPDLSQLGSSPVVVAIALASIVPVLLNCNVCHQSLHPLLPLLKPYSVARMQRLVATALCVCNVLYFTVTICAGLVFGDALDADVLANITVAAMGPLIGPAAAVVMSFAVRVGYLLSIIGSYVLLCYPLRQCIGDLMLPGSVHYSCSDNQVDCVNMASSSQGVTVEIPGHTGPAAQRRKPSAQAANPEDRYAPGAAPAAASGSQSWLQSNLYLILFCVGWVFFPCWWAAALLGAKAGHTGRRRLSRQERTAWQASIVLSLIGIALFLLFIIWYGADPQGAKATLIKYTGFGGPSNLQDATPSASPSPSPVLPAVLTKQKPRATLVVAAAGGCNDTMHDLLVNSVNSTLLGQAPADVQDNILVAKGLCINVTTAEPNRRLLAVVAKYEVLVNTTADTDAAALDTVNQILQNVTQPISPTANASQLAWCGDFCQQHESDIVMAQTGADIQYDIVNTCGQHTCSAGTLLGSKVLDSDEPSDALCCLPATPVPSPSPEAPSPSPVQPSPSPADPNAGAVDPSPSPADPSPSPADPSPSPADPSPSPADPSPSPADPSPSPADPSPSPADPSPSPADPSPSPADPSPSPVDPSPSPADPSPSPADPSPSPADPSPSPADPSPSPADPSPSPADPSPSPADPSPSPADPSPSPADPSPSPADPSPSPADPSPSPADPSPSPADPSPSPVDPSPSPADPSPSPADPSPSPADPSPSPVDPSPSPVGPSPSLMDPSPSPVDPSPSPVDPSPSPVDPSPSPADPSPSPVDPSPSPVDPSHSPVDPSPSPVDPSPSPVDPSPSPVDPSPSPVDPSPSPVDPSPSPVDPSPSPADPSPSPVDPSPSPVDPSPSPADPSLSPADPSPSPVDPSPSPVDPSPSPVDPSPSPVDPSPSPVDPSPSPVDPSPSPVDPSPSPVDPSPSPVDPSPSLVDPSPSPVDPSPSPVDPSPSTVDPSPSPVDPSPSPVDPSPSPVDPSPSPVDPSPSPVDPSPSPVDPSPSPVDPSPSPVDPSPSPVDPSPSPSTSPAR